MLTLGSNEVHIWSVSLNPAEAVLEARHCLLSEDELARASRFRFPEHRRRYLAARGALRHILAAYLGTQGRDVSFVYGAAGKPNLPAELGKGLQFNLSHSGELAVVALAARRTVGVDVELVRPIDDVEGMIGRFFSKGERTDLFALPEHERVEAFFRCWTRKEAFIKATGDGLGLPLDQFRVSLRTGDPVRLLWAGDGGSSIARWRLENIHVAPGFVGAVAVEAGDWILVERGWTA